MEWTPSSNTNRSKSARCRRQTPNGCFYGHSQLDQVLDRVDLRYSRLTIFSSWIQMLSQVPQHCVSINDQVLRSLKYFNSSTNTAVRSPCTIWILKKPSNWKFLDLFTYLSAELLGMKNHYFYGDKKLESTTDGW